MVDLERLKKKVEQLRRDADRNAGMEAQILADLKKDFGANSLAAAKVLLEKANKEAEEAEAEFSEALKEFEDKWAERLK